MMSTVVTIDAWDKAEAIQTARDYHMPATGREVNISAELESTEPHQAGPGMTDRYRVTIEVTDS